MYLTNLAVNLALKYMPNYPFMILYNLIWARGRLRITRAEEGWLITCFPKSKRERSMPKLSFLASTPKCLAGGWDEFEHKVERFFKIEPDDTVLDAGACNGDLTVPMAMKAKKVIAIEPHPVNAKYLRMNLRPFTNCTVIEKALWKEKGQVTFHLYYLPTGHSIGYIKGNEETITVEADTLDNLFLGQKIDFVKIDVQAAEVDVLEAGKKFLSTVPKLIVETHYRTLPKRTYPRCLEIVKELGFHTEFAWDNGIIYAWRK